MSGGHGPESIPDEQPVVRFDDGYDDDQLVQEVVKGIRRYGGTDYDTAVEFVYFWATLTRLSSEQTRAVLERFPPAPGGKR